MGADRCPEWVVGQSEEQSNESSGQAKAPRLKAYRAFAPLQNGRRREALDEVQNGWFRQFQTTSRRQSYLLLDSSSTSPIKIDVQHEGFL
jgi:hypothetical protein